MHHDFESHIGTRVKTFKQGRLWETQTSHHLSQEHCTSAAYFVVADESGNMIWNIDASFVVHHDCKSPIGASLMPGQGNVLSQCLQSKKAIPRT